MPMQRRSRPTLMVLAASIYQLPFIQSALRMGCTVITVDNRPDNPGHRLAHSSLICDTTDVGSLVSLAREQRIDGIVAAATDVALDGAAAVAEALGLPGPSSRCTSVLTRKFEFRMLQSTLELPHPKFHRTLDGVQFPGTWIVKPNRASGSKGIRIVDEPRHLADAWKLARHESVDGTAVVEQYRTGVQGTIEGVMHDGTIAASLATERSTANWPAAGTRRHRTPASFETTAIDLLEQQIERVFHYLGYRTGPFDADFLVDEHGVPQLIEMTPRAGGNSLVRLLQHSAGFDMTEYAVRAALGEATAPAQFDPLPTIVEILGVNEGGRITYDEEEARHLPSALPGIRYLQIDVRPGDRVERFMDGRHRIGEMVAVGSTVSAADEIIADAYRRLQFRVY